MIKQKIQNKTWLPTHKVNYLSWLQIPAWPKSTAKGWKHSMAAYTELAHFQNIAEGGPWYKKGAVLMKYRLLNIVIFLIVIFLSSTCRCTFQLQHIYTHTQTHKQTQSAHWINKNKNPCCRSLQLVGKSWDASTVECEACTAPPWQN